MSDRLICPTCHTVIQPGERCPEVRGMGRCMETVGHDGYHWSDFGHGDGSVTIWHGPYIAHTCPERLSLSDWCKRPPGHDGPHNNGRGVTFTPAPEEDTP